MNECSCAATRGCRYDVEVEEFGVGGRGLVVRRDELGVEDRLQEVSLCATLGFRKLRF